MKMRNMLQSIPLLLLIAAGLSVFLNCKAPASNPTPPAPSTPPTSSTPSTSTFYTVTFDAQGGSAVASVSVEHGKTFTQPSDPVKAPFSFGGWYKERECTTPWNFATDTVTSDMTLYAQWTTIIRFNANKMICQKGNDRTPVNPGETVYENERLEFEATLPAGQTVNKWTVNGVEKLDKTKPWLLRYTVRAEDVQGGSITIDYTEKQAAYATISFNPSKMKCRKILDISFTGTPVLSGDTVYEHDHLMFSAQPAAGKMADSWTVNGAPLKNADVIGNNVFYQIDSSSSSSLNFDYTEKTAEKLELQFDASRIQCTKLPDQTPVSPGPRDEGDALLFSPKDGSIVAWKVNGKPYDIIIMEKSCLLEFTKKAAKKYGNENVLTVSY